MWYNEGFFAKRELTDHNKETGTECKNQVWQGGSERESRQSRPFSTQSHAQPSPAFQRPFWLKQVPHHDPSFSQCGFITAHLGGACYSTALSLFFFLSMRLTPVSAYSAGFFCEEPTVNRFEPIPSGPCGAEIFSRISLCLI